MRAVVCKEFGPPENLAVEEVAPPRPGAGQIVLEVKACGVNYPDLLIVQGKYQLKPPLPFSPGGEVAGVVREVGDEVSGIRPGDRVLAQCGVGGFAEQVAVAAAQCLPMPASMDFPHAATLITTYGTTYHALVDRGRLKAGESLLVLGAAGGVGLSAVELGHVMGARVIAGASSDDKLEVCRQYGARDLINYSREDLKSRLKDLTAGRGVDVVYDPVGGELAEAALRATAWDGRFLVIGFTAGIPSIPLNLVLLKGCQVVGVFWGAWAARNPARNRENIMQLLDWCAHGKIKPLVSATYPLDRAAEALDDMAQRRVKGKVALVP